MIRFARLLVPAALALAASVDLAQAQEPLRQGTRATYSGRHHGTPSYGQRARFGNPRSYECSRNRPCNARIWVPGRFETVQEKVWVEGRTRRQWIPDRFETRYTDCGSAYQVLVEPGHYEIFQEPGCWETRFVRVFQPGHWEQHC